MLMTSSFRRLALAFPEAVESSHMGAADFRINGRIFATLAYERKGLGTLKLTPEQQAAFLDEGSEYFTPAPGGWGHAGMTLVRLDAPEAVLAGALQSAYRNAYAQPSATKTPLRSDAAATRAAGRSRRGKTT